MRSGLVALGLVVSTLLAVLFVGARQVELPRIGPRVEDVCVETMKRSPPDQSWVVEGYQPREIQDVQLGELVSHHGDLVRVAGVLHAEFEWVALYSSRAAMEESPDRAPWVGLTSLDLRPPMWPSISDRCVVLEGRYRSGAGGHLRMFDGHIDPRRLDVWSTPHRPFVSTPIVPPPPPLASAPGACSEPTRAPTPLAAGGGAQTLADSLAQLYETGEFGQGFCVVNMRVREDGRIDSVRVLPDVDRRVAAVLVRSLGTRRYTPARFCDRPVSFTLTVTVSHCPTPIDR